MPMSENRTKWPVNGGAIAFQPGWFYGHHTAFMYFNLGLGNQPDNYSFTLLLRLPKVLLLLIHQNAGERYSQ